MKLFLVLALAAAVLAEPEAEAEADPYLLYSNHSLYGTHGVHGVRSYGAYPFVRSYSTYGGHYTGYPYYGTRHVYKREAEAEPEADPALVYSTGVHGVYGSPLVSALSPVVKTVAAPVTYTSHHTPVVYNTGVQTPVVYKTGVQTPVVYNTGVHTPVVYNTGVQTPFVYNTGVVAPATHTVTNYENPLHYTAVSNGVYGPKYIAKNYGVQHVVKREAEAEAEADPALLYTSSHIASPITYSGHVAPVVNTVAAPATYLSSHVAPVVKTVAAPVTYTVPTAVHRPAYTYTSHVTPVVKTVASPVTYTVPAVHSIPAAYSNPVHAVAQTAAGLTHSSNVGVCTNVHGVQVPC